MKKRNKKNKLSAEELRHRKRLKKVNAVAERLNITIVLSTIIFGTLCLIFLKRPTTSEIENRKLAEFPEFTWEDYFSGKFTDGISEFFSDSAPYRDQIHELGSYMKKVQGFKTEKSYVFSGNVEVVADDEGNVLETGSSAAVTDAISPETTAEAAESNVSPIETEPSETLSAEETTAETEAEEVNIS